MANSTENIFDELRNKVKGDVFTDKIRRYMHSTDGSIFRMEPACVVYPKSNEDVLAVCNFANKYQLSIHSRGAGSGLCGAAIGRGIVLDFSKYMNNLISYDKLSEEEEAVFTCEPGYRYGELEAYLKGTGFWFPASPSSGEYATFGGMYGTNAGGAYSVKYGNVADYLVDAEVVLHDGTITTFSKIAETSINDLPQELQDVYSLLLENQDEINNAYPPIACNVCGYELRDVVKNSKLFLHKLFGGSEGTLGIITKLTFKVIRKKPCDGLVIAYFNDKTSCSKAAQIGLTYNPAGIEIMDKSLLELAVTHEPSLADKIPNDIDNVLMFEFEGETIEEVRKQAQETVEKINKAGLSDRAFIAVSEDEKSQFWAVRKAAVPILYLLKGKKKILALVEDAAVPTDKLVEYFDGLYEIFERHKVQFVSYGHIAKGLLHNRPLLDLKDSYDIKLLKTLADEVFDLVHKLNGTISGEHGDGRIRSYYIHKQYSATLYSLFQRVKSILDPDRLFNPEIKTVEDPLQMTKHLRYGADYSAIDKDKKQLVWEEDFVLEAEKCHGCSKCTTVTLATRMCPIYKALRDEAAAPKAKANILRGLLSNAIDNQMMYEEAFQYVINHCVNCGSCSRECPSKVNIPKLALEAKSRYAEKFGVSLDARLATNFEAAGRLTRKFSSITSAVMKPKVSRNMLQITTGLASEREFVKFAKKSLFERINKTEGTGNKVVMYFAGCYASFVKPEIGESTIKVLNHLGFKVVTPEQHCCGIPHLSKGMAKGARSQIKKNIKEWGKLIDQVDYIVSSCSSCTLSLTKEWLYYQNDEITQKIKDKTIFAMDLISQYMQEDSFIGEDMSLVYHSPCHMKLLKSPNSTINVLRNIDNVTVDTPNTGCCGMAGSWGMSAKNYDLSINIGKKMIEKLNNSNGTVCITECPTCTMQIEHLGNKEVIHPIEVLAKCIKK